MCHHDQAMHHPMRKELIKALETERHSLELDNRQYAARVGLNPATWSIIRRGGKIAADTLWRIRDARPDLGGMCYRVYREQYEARREKIAA